MASTFDLRKSTIVELESRIGLGLDVPNRAHNLRCANPPVIADLADGIFLIKERYVDCHDTAIRESKAVRQEANALFYKLGPKLWPDEDNKPRPSWLLQPFNDLREDTPWANKYHNLYPQKLSFSEPRDRIVLQTGFINLIYKKIRGHRDSRRHRNTREARNHRLHCRETDEELSDLSELSEFESDDGEAEDESEIRITPPENFGHKVKPQSPSSTRTPLSSATKSPAHMMGNTHAKLEQLKRDERVGLRCKECISRSYSLNKLQHAQARTDFLSGEKLPCKSCRDRGLKCRAHEVSTGRNITGPSASYPPTRLQAIAQSQSMSFKAPATSTTELESLRDSEPAERYKRRLGNDDYLAPSPKKRNLAEQASKDLRSTHDEQPRNSAGQLLSISPERSASTTRSFGAPDNCNSQPGSHVSSLRVPVTGHTDRDSKSPIAGEPRRHHVSMNSANNEEGPKSLQELSGTASIDALEHVSMAQSTPAAAQSGLSQDSARAASRSQETFVDGTSSQQHKATSTAQFWGSDNMDDELAQPFIVRAARSSVREQGRSSSSGDRTSALSAGGRPAPVVVTGSIDVVTSGTQGSAHPSGQQIHELTSHAAISLGRNGASPALLARPISPPDTEATAWEDHSADRVHEVEPQEEDRQSVKPTTTSMQSCSGISNGRRQLVSDALLFKDTTMFLRLQRESVPEPENMNAVDLGDVTSRNGFWNAIYEELESELGPSEELFKAVIKRTSGLPVERINTDFRMTRSSGRNRSWEDMLKGLRVLYVNEGRTVEWELEAIVYVRRKVDATLQEEKVRP